MIAQPGFPANAASSLNVEHEVLQLRAEVADLRLRLSNLEVARSREARDSRVLPHSSLFPPSAPVMDFARSLCAELFPGTSAIEVATAPGDPSAQWYVFHVVCHAEMQECLDREAKFGLRLHDAFPEQAGDIRLSVGPCLPTGTESTTPRELVACDSPEMAQALQLCQEIFPGCTTDVEVLWDPSEPKWPWYVVNVHWKGEVRDSIDRQMNWHEKLEAAFPQIGDQFRMFVDLQ